MTEKKRFLSKPAIQRMVKTVWMQWFRYEDTKSGFDYEVYKAQKIMAEKAIEAGRPAWKKEFKLP